MKKFLLLLLGLIIAFVFYTLSSTGFFRSIENSTGFSITRSIDIPGAEDFAISREEGFLIISSDDRAAKFSDKKRKGGLYFLDLKTENAVPKLMSGHFNKPFLPHGISLIRLDSAKYKLFVINHVGDDDYVEVFRLEGDQLIHEQTLEDNLLFSPNDIVAIDEHRFYFTNDHLTDAGFGKFAANYLGKSDANVGYYDGEKFSIVAEGIHYANGINFDKNRNLLYVASLRKFSVKVYQYNENGSLGFIEDIACGTGVDNIELDKNGHLWVGCHPNLLTALGHLGGKPPHAPSEAITIEYRGKGDYSVESVYVDDGKIISACSVALPYKDEIFLGDVMDDHFVVVRKGG